MRCWFVPIAACCLLLLPALAQEPPPENSSAQPLTMPRPVYPRMAAFFGMSGHCEVRFSVDEEGYTFNLFPSCTDYIFCFAAKRAINEVRFTPEYENGRPQVRTNIVYPLDFVVDGRTSESIDRSRMKPCRKRAIS